MAEYEDCDLGSPGPNSSLTLEELRGRMRYLVESLGQVREMVSETSLGFQTTVGKLDRLAHGMNGAKKELQGTREMMEQKKDEQDQELDPQTERALTKFFTDNLRTTTAREDFALCRKIRGSYPQVDKISQRREERPIVAQPKYTETGLFMF